MVLPTVSVPATLQVTEGSALTIPLTKSGSGQCAVQLRTSGISAKNLDDYVGYDETTIVFTEDQTEASGTLATLSDDVLEPDETLTVWVVNPSGCTVTQGKCLVTIEDVQTASLPTVSIPEQLTVREGDVLTIPVTKQGDGSCSVRLRTIGDTARTLLDYEGYDPYPTVVFADTSTAADAALKTLPDSLVEGPETLTVALVEPTGCKLGQAHCVVAIEDATDPATPVDPTNPAGPDTPTGPTPPPDSNGTDPLPSRYPRFLGFATNMTAGTGKELYRVTSLKDGGPGSLRDGLSRGNRLIAFEVAGCIRLGSNLTVDYDNVTIAGQTAPPPGITVQVKELQVRASNIRVEHIAFERGHDASNTGNADVVKISPGSRSSTFRRSGVHFNHCAFFWGTDETVEIWPSGGNLSNISFTDCIFSEPLWRPQRLGFKAHEKVAKGMQSEHNYGLLLGYETKKVDVQGCLFQDMYFRTPFIDHGTTSVIANNILQNVRMGVSINQNVSPPAKEACLVNAQGILVISGPQSNNTSGFRFHFYPPKWPAGSGVYVSNLYGWRGANTSITPGTSITFARGQPTQGKGTPVLVRTPPIQPPGTVVRALSAEDLFDRVVGNVGPMPRAARRNPAVARVVNKLRSKASGWVDHQSQVGGYSNYPAVTRRLEDVTLPDGTPVPVPNPTDAAAVGRWLNIHTSLVSHD